MSHRAARQNIGSLRVNLSNLQIFMIFVIFNNTESNTSKAKYVECGSDLLENVKEVYICFESSLLAECIENSCLSCNLQVHLNSNLAIH